MKFLASLIIAASLLFAAPAMAQRVGGRHAWIDLGTLIAAQTAAAPRSFTVNNSAFGMGVLWLFIKETRDGGLSNVTMSCTASEDDNTTDYLLQDCSVAAGVCSSSDASWSQTIAANKNWIWRVDVLGVPGDLECTFSFTGGDAGDAITVDGWMVTQ